jgi:streptogrisin C
MKPIKMAGACVVVAVAAGAAFASASYADVPSSGAEGPSPLFAKEVAVLTKQGISPTRAGQALDVQGKVARANLVSEVEAAMGSAYAGAWFEPAAAQVHFGVTSEAGRRAAQRIVAQAGLTAVVTYTPVRSTWSALMAVQSWWNKRLVDMSASQDAMTGLDSQRNAVVVTLGSSAPAGERATLEREAAAGSVNVVVEIAPQLHLGAEPQARCKKFKTFEEPECSAGPMLIEGNETYMLTAGHCFAKKVGEEGKVEVKVTSAYPEKEKPAQKVIGNTGEWKYLLSKDMAIVKITRPGSFNQELPTPVPALMMEWGIKTETPSAVIGEAANIKGETNCREGMTSGEACGKILRVNISSPSGFEHLVEDTACSDGGDSGGPFFFSGGKVNNVTMQGILARGEKSCGEEGAKTWYEPLKDEGAVGFGILSTFAGKELLTTANEMR